MFGYAWFPLRVASAMIESAQYNVAHWYAWTCSLNNFLEIYWNKCYQINQVIKWIIFDGTYKFGRNMVSSVWIYNLNTFKALEESIALGVGFVLKSYFVYFLKLILALQNWNLLQNCVDYYVLCCRQREFAKSKYGRKKGRSRKSNTRFSSWYLPQLHCC